MIYILTSGLDIPYNKDKFYVLEKGSEKEESYHIWENTENRQRNDSAHYHILGLMANPYIIMMRDTPDHEKINDLSAVDATITFRQILVCSSAVRCM